MSKVHIHNLRLALLRHASAEWPLPGESDINRRLSEAGENEAGQTSDYLRDSAFIPDIAIISPALRCKQTWDIVQEIYDGQVLTVEVSELYHSSVDDYLSVVLKYRDASSLLLVGHNPTLEEFIEKVAGTNIYLEAAPFGLQTSALVMLDLEIDQLNAIVSCRLHDSFAP